MPNLWLCGITQNGVKDLKEMLDPLAGPEFFENTNFGICFVDGGSTDLTTDYLDRIGAVCLHRRWTNDHDMQMNAYLRSGYIQHGDWVIQIDTSERIHPDFVRKLLGGMLENFEKQGINTVMQRSKPILFRYYDDQMFNGNPHWGIMNTRRHIVDICTFNGFENDETYFWSNRRTNERWITNGFKYYYVYGRSNHMWLVYNKANYPGTTDKLIFDHERVRHEFRDYCRNELNLPIIQNAATSLDAFNEFLQHHKFDKKFIDFMNFEKVIANYYRYMILGEDVDEIKKTENSWKFTES